MASFSKPCLIPYVRGCGGKEYTVQTHPDFLGSCNKSVKLLANFISDLDLIRLTISPTILGFFFCGPTGKVNKVDLSPGSPYAVLHRTKNVFSHQENTFQLKIEYIRSGQTLSTQIQPLRALSPHTKLQLLRQRLEANPGVLDIQYTEPSPFPSPSPSLDCPTYGIDYFPNAELDQTWIPADLRSADLSVEPVATPLEYPHREDLSSQNYQSGGYYGYPPSCSTPSFSPSFGFGNQYPAAATAPTNSGAYDFGSTSTSHTYFSAPIFGTEGFPREDVDFSPQLIGSANWLSMISVPAGSTDALPLSWEAKEDEDEEMTWDELEDAAYALICSDDPEMAEQISPEEYQEILHDIFPGFDFSQG